VICYLQTVTGISMLSVTARIDIYKWYNLANKSIHQ